MIFRLLTFAVLFCISSSAQAVLRVWVEVPHDDSGARDEARKLPESTEPAMLVILLERLATADRSQVLKDVRFPYNYNNLSQEQIEKRLGKPIEFKASNYARPCAGDEIIFPGGFQRRDLKDGKQHGLWKRYRENGKPYDEGQFVDGKKSGIWKSFDAAGKLSRTKTF